jgi:hypothetical protein
LVKEWTGRLRPLEDNERDILLSKLDSVCVDGTAVLRSGRITASDLKENISAAGALELEAWLCSGLPDQLAGYLPSVIIARDNQLAWRKWYEGRRVPLGILVDALGGLPPNWKSELQTKAREGWDRLLFSSSKVVADFLLEYGHDIDDVDQRLDEISPTFKPVTSAPLPTSVTGWRAARGRSGPGHGGPHRKITVNDLVEESLARGAIGDAAEQALLKWVVEQVAPLQGLKGFADTVLSVFKKGTKTWREIKDALDHGDLESALYVAEKWSGAGFDMLGVELSDGELTPVRYECKGISSSSKRVRVYLSRNELGVARRVYRDGPGRWMLVGVQTDGTCVDMTSLIVDLLDDAEVPLKPLHDRGLEPDGLRLVVERVRALEEPE